MLGILSINKPKGITSHDVVARVRRKLQTKRVGHAGTLDPMATGVLVVAVGQATRFLQYLSLEPKVYTGRALFGVETDSQDAEGQIVKESAVPKDLDTLIQQHKISLVGEIEQIPPMYSAVKKAGQPLYRYARKGIEVERSPRKVHIHSFDVHTLSETDAEFSVTCSGGTYIRTLLHDLGQLVGCGAHLTALNRTQVGQFKLETSIALDEVSESHLIKLNDCLAHLPSVQLHDDDVSNIYFGRRVNCSVCNGLCVLLSQKGNVIAMAQANQQLVYPICVIPKEITD